MDHFAQRWRAAAAWGGPFARCFAQGHKCCIHLQRPGLAGKINPIGQAAQLIHGEGQAKSLRWSPDGSKLAFVSDRGDHSLIGVYDVAQNSLHYLDPSVDLDSDPVWSPDSNQIAFIRIPASEHERIFEPERTGEPWSIRVADTTTGTGKEVWKADTGPGSVSMVSLLKSVDVGNGIF